jgi:uncharacterized membrane protein
MIYDNITKIEDVQRLYRKLIAETNVIARSEALLDLVDKYSVAQFNLYGFIGDMTEVNIAHVVAKLEELSKDDVPCPILVREKNASRYFMIIEADLGGGLKVFDCYNDDIIIMEVSVANHLFDQWCVLVEPLPLLESSIKDLGNNNDTFASRYRLKAFVLIVVMLLLFSAYNIFLGVASVFLFIGLIVCFELWHEESGSKSLGLAEKVCKLGESEDCSDVLKSSISKIYGNFTISHLAGFYVLSLLLHLIVTVSYGNIELASVLFMLYITVGFIASVGAIYTQKFVLKKFCALCLILATSIIAMSSCFYIYFFFYSKWQTAGWNLVISLLLAGVIAKLYLLTIDNEQVVKSFKNDLFAIKARHDVFTALYQINSRHSEIKKTQVLLEYEPGRKKVDLVISDTCKFCENTLQELLNLLQLSEHYFVSLNIDSVKSGSETVRWLLNIVGRNQYVKPNMILFTVVHNGALLFNGCLDDPELLELDPIVLKSGFNNVMNIQYFPTVCLSGRNIPDFYTASSTKRHLVLSQYN